MTAGKTNDRVCLGAFAGAHGVKGDAKVKTFTAHAEDIASYGLLSSEDGKQVFTLTFIRVLKPSLALVRAPEIKSREDAAALAGIRLYAPRSVLPAPEADEFYIEDLVGLDAVDENGAPAGAVVAIHNFGAGDILELTGVPGRKGAVMAPFTKAAVPAVDLAAGIVTVARAYLDDHDNDAAERANASTADHATKGGD